MTNITINIDDHTSPHMLRALATMMHQLQHTAVDDTPPLATIAPKETWRVPEQEQTVVSPLLTAVTPELDADGLPWDERIHSDTKALNSDGTWRLRRNINTKSPGLVERVRAEQRAALAAPRVETQSDYAAVLIEQNVDTPPLTPASEPVPAAPPPPPSPSAAAPLPSVPLEVREVTDPATTFRLVLQRLTQDQASGAITAQQVDAALASVGLATLRDLPLRLDLVGAFEQALYAGK